MKLKLAVASILLLALTSAFAAETPQTKRVVFAVSGMQCGSCAEGIKAMLKRSEGVKSAEVSFETKEAVVDFDPSKTSPEKIIEAITNLGYKASVKKTDQAS